MSKRCSVLVWIRPQPPVLSPSAMLLKHQPGDVVDVQAGDFDFGSEVAHLGWWRVISVAGPAGLARGLLSGDAEVEGQEHKPRRIRTRRLDLSRLEARMALADFLAAAQEVPRPTFPSIG